MASREYQQLSPRYLGSAGVAGSLLCAPRLNLNFTARRLNGNSHSLKLLLYQHENRSTRNACRATVAAYRNAIKAAQPSVWQHLPVDTFLPSAGELAAAKASGGAGKRTSAHSKGAGQPVPLLAECAALRQDAGAAEDAAQQEQSAQQRADTEQAAEAARTGAALTLGAAHVKAQLDLAEQLPALLAVAPRLAELPAHLDEVLWKSAEVCSAAPPIAVASVVFDCHRM